MSAPFSAEGMSFQFSPYTAEPDEVCAGLELCKPLEKSFQTVLLQFLADQQVPARGKHLDGVLSPIVQLLRENHGILRHESLVRYVPQHENVNFRVSIFRINQFLKLENFPYTLGKPSIIAVIQKNPSDVSDLSTESSQLRTQTGFFTAPIILKELARVLPQLEIESQKSRRNWGKVPLWYTLAKELVAENGAVSRRKFRNQRSSVTAYTHAILKLNRICAEIAENICIVSPRIVSLKDNTPQEHHE